MQTSQLIFTCSQSSIETEKVLIYVQKLTIKTPERRHGCCAGVFIVNFEHITHLFLMSLLLTLNKWMLNGL